jgi:hypothetical protein
MRLGVHYSYTHTESSTLTAASFASFCLAARLDKTNDGARFKERTHLIGVFHAYGAA